MDPQMELMLQLMDQPVFLVRGDRVLWNNQAAGDLVYQGQELETILPEWRDLYDQWDRQSVVETDLTLMGLSYSLKLRACEAGELFVLRRKTGEWPFGGETVPHTSGKLRRILQELFPACTTLQDYMDDREELVNEAARINHSLYRLLRLSNKLSREERLLHDDAKPYFQRTDLRTYIREFFYEAAPVVEDGGWKLVSGPMNSSFHGNIDRELMKQALYYMLSHGLLHSPKGSELLLKCWEDGNWIRFSLTHMVENESRDEGLEREDLDFARAVASLHAGSLIQFFQGQDSKHIVLNIRKLPATFPLKETRLSVDFYGSFHPGLVELSDALETRMYHPDRV